MDLEAIREHVLYQKSLCFEIRALDDELRVLGRQMAVASGLQPEGMSRAAFEGLCDADSHCSCDKSWTISKWSRGVCGG